MRRRRPAPSGMVGVVPRFLTSPVQPNAIRTARPVVGFQRVGGGGGLAAMVAAADGAPRVRAVALGPVQFGRQGEAVIGGGMLNPVNRADPLTGLRRCAFGGKPASPLPP
jgi:hypothetical protein